MFALVAASLALIGAQAPIEVPFKIGDDAIIVDSVINGKKASLMFDTGFSGMVVLTDSLNIGAPTGTMNLRDFVGSFEARTVAIKTMKLGELNVSAQGEEVVQQPMDHLSLSYNTHTDGILGLSVMKDHVLEINFENQKLIFHPKTHDVTQRQPDGERTFLARMLPIGARSIEMQVETESGKKMNLALDTGNAFYATTHKEVLERVGVWESGREVKFMKTAMVASGPVDSWYKEMPPLKIYGVPVDRSYWSIIDLPSSSSEHDGTIGFGFLKNFNITIDLERRRVWLEKFAETVGNTPSAEVGINAMYSMQSGRVVIVNVTPESPAALAGVQRGDILLTVDGKEVLAKDFRSISKLLEGDLGSRVQVAVSSGGVVKRLELERVHLVNALETTSKKSPSPASAQ